MKDGDIFIDNKSGSVGMITSDDIYCHIWFVYKMSVVTLRKGQRFWDVEKDKYRIANKDYGNWPACGPWHTERVQGSEADDVTVIGTMDDLLSVYIRPLLKSHGIK